MGLFSKLFKKTPQLDPIDLGLLHTDVHSHLIPGIDDGSKSIEDTFQLLEEFVALGYKKVITTPHVMSDFYKNTPEIILSGLKDVKAYIQEKKLDIEIEAAAEYYLDFHFEELIESDNLLTFGDNYVLFELSFMQEPRRIKEVIFNLQTKGYKPILAHVERYPFYFNQWDKIEDFMNRGCIMQLNINSLSGVYGPQVKKMAEDIVQKGWISLIGSDCHHMGHLEILNDMRKNPFLHQVMENKNLLNYHL